MPNFLCAPATSLRIIAFAFVAITCGTSRAQEPTASPEVSAAPTVEPTIAATPILGRSVRISFIPPPLEGTISLGIYDLTGRLVRVLHQQAGLDAFTIGADALVTRWDGKDDDGQDLPAGKYHARGYVVGALQLDKLDDNSAPPSAGAVSEKIAVKLVSNPLGKNSKANVELTAGFDDTDSFLETADELPLYIISERTDIRSIIANRNGQNSVDVWQDSDAGMEHFRISKLDQMMAFDCGTLDLK
ncbi:MAG: hypothetical protein ACJ8M1_03690 [Chthoniobacterales bacterium]